ncbi:metal-dependent transcriptional regulator [Candidatus Proelusimicrobium excrementi]|uniref:metal-dependent transcriptional regulator n=2 Tax=Candidatus Proelusimicrobium excrementi TaxID=3416222 RepID=UPI003D0B32E9
MRARLPNLKSLDNKPKVRQTNIMNSVTSSMEDYLEAISIACEGEKGARVTDIKILMNVKTPSVSGALKALEARGLITHEKYGRVQLTKDGQAIAREVKKKHSVISEFLRDIVGVRPATAEIDACKIEHVLSKETFVKLMEFVGKHTGKKQS